MSRVRERALNTRGKRKITITQEGGSSPTAEVYGCYVRTETSSLPITSGTFEVDYGSTIHFYGKSGTINISGKLPYVTSLKCYKNGGAVGKGPSPSQYTLMYSMVVKTDLHIALITGTARKQTWTFPYPKITYA